MQKFENMIFEEVGTLINIRYKLTKRGFRKLSPKLMFDTYEFKMWAKDYPMLARLVRNIIMGNWRITKEGKK